MLSMSFLVAVSEACLVSLGAMSLAIQIADCTSVQGLCLGLFALCVGCVASFIVWKPKSVYVVDFACFRAPDDWRIPFASFMEHSILSGRFEEKSIEFQRKILARSGLSQRTALPPSLHFLPPKVTMPMERAETETAVLTVLDELFSKTWITPGDIGILVINCSVFCPVPSLSTMIVNRYKLRSDIKSYNLSGMGCSAGLVSLDLASSVLQFHRATYALVISHDNMTRNWYLGNNRSMLVTNCIFRAAAAAALLSNKFIDRRRSKYQLKHTVRTHTGSDEGYQCIFQEEDEWGVRGVRLSKELMGCAGNALKNNLLRLVPLVLPISELLTYVVNFVIKEKLHKERKPYIPDLKLAFDHFCIHAGGKAVIQQVEKNLLLAPEHTEAARMTLHRFGNVSSSSVWYALAYLEAKMKVKRNHRIWLIGLGSGFKCCSGVLRALRTIDLDEATDAWKDCIMEYPVDVPEVEVF